MTDDPTIVYPGFLPMTAKAALNMARHAEPGERLRRYETICALRGACRRRPLIGPGRWT